MFRVWSSKHLLITVGQ